MKKHSLFLTLLLLMTFIMSCNKDSLTSKDELDDFNLENFLSDSYFKSYNPNYNPLPLLESRSSENMTNAVKDYFANNPKEAKQVEAKYGVPIWDKIFYMNGEMGHFAKIPLAKKNSKNVEAVMFASLNSNLKLDIKIYHKNDIKALKKKKEVRKDKNYFLELPQDYFAGALMYFDKVTFQTADCSLTDYFEKGNGVVEDNYNLEQRTCVTYIIETTWYQIVYTSTGALVGTSVLSSTYDIVRICTDYGGYGGTTVWNGDYYGNGTIGGTTNVSNTFYTLPIVKTCSNEFDQIIIEPSFLNCPKMKCVYDYLDRKGSALFCQNIGIFGGNNSNKPNLFIKTVFEQGPREAWVSLQPITGRTHVSLVFNIRHCDNEDYLYLASTLIHEAQHARWRYDFYKRFMNENLYRSEFAKYMENVHGIGFNIDHFVMIKSYMEKFALELSKLDGSRYDKSYYMAYVWDGLSFWWNDAFTPEIKNEWENKRNIVKANNPWRCH